MQTRAFLCFKDRSDSNGVGRIRSESINGFNWKRNDLALSQQFNCMPDGFVLLRCRRGSQKISLHLASTSYLTTSRRRIYHPRSRAREPQDVKDLKFCSVISGTLGREAARLNSQFESG